MIRGSSTDHPVHVGFTLPGEPTPPVIPPAASNEEFSPRNLLIPMSFSRNSQNMPRLDRRSLQTQSATVGNEYPMQRSLTRRSIGNHPDLQFLRREDFENIRNEVFGETLASPENMAEKSVENEVFDKAPILIETMAGKAVETEVLSEAPALPKEMVHKFTETDVYVAGRLVTFANQSTQTEEFFPHN